MDFFDENLLQDRSNSMNRVSKRQSRSQSPISCLQQQQPMTVFLMDKNEEYTRSLEMQFKQMRGEIHVTVKKYRNAEALLGGVQRQLDQFDVKSIIANDQADSD